MKNTLTNKIVLITGSGSGIGKATAIEFCKKGAVVILNGRDENKLIKTQKDFYQEGYDVDYCVADVTNKHDCAWLHNYIITRYGKIDVVVANGSVSMNARFDESSQQHYKEVVCSTIFSVTTPLFAFLEDLKKSAGSFIIISSLAGLHGVPTASAYSMGKMALTALHQSVSAELYSTNVHLGIVYVGFTENDLDKKTYSHSGQKVSVPKRNKLLQQTQSHVAAAILRCVEKRKNSLVLSSVGKITYFLSRFAPFVIRIAGRKASERIKRIE